MTQEQFMEELARLDLAIRAKVFENSLNKTCMKKCCDLRDDHLQDEEQMCLNACMNKRNRFLEISKEIYKESEGPESEIRHKKTF